MIIILFVYGMDAFDFENNRNIWGIIHFVGGFSLFYLTVVLFNHYRINGLLPIFYKASDLSYFVYLVHGVIILGPFSVLSLTNYLYLNIAIAFMLIWVMAETLAATTNIIQNKIRY